MIENTANQKANNAIKKKHQKRKKQESPESFLRYSDLSKESDYKSKRCNKKTSYQKRDHIKLCAKLTAKLLTTAYKSKIIKLKLGKDPLQRCIYIFTFIESPEMIFSQYTETCELLLDYPRIEGEDNKGFSKKSLGNILHENIDVHNRRLIAEFPGYGINCIEKLQ